MKDVTEVEPMSKEEAEKLYLMTNEIITQEQYVRVLKEAYKWISEGKTIIDLYEVFKKTGTNENGLPKLAIAKADQKKVYLTTKGNFANAQTHNLIVSLPYGTFPELKKMIGTRIRYYTRVPIIPVEHFPKDSLKKYYILWEVESWEEETMPEDPLLLKRLTKNLFVVIAEWDLTPLEKAIMKGL